MGARQRCALLPGGQTEEQAISTTPYVAARLYNRPINAEFRSGSANSKPDNKAESLFLTPATSVDVSF